MAITSLSQEQRIGTPDGIMWRMTALPADRPLYYWYIDGVLSYTTERNWIDVIVPWSADMNVQVFDDPATAPAAVYPSRMLIQWERTDGAQYYLVEQYDAVTDTWSAVHQVRENGSWMYYYWTNALSDGVEYTYRIRAIGIGNHDGGSQQFTFDMVCRPAWPDQSITYDAENGNIEIAIT